MFTERTSVGLDVHARSVVAAAIDGVTGDRVKTDARDARAWPAPLIGARHTLDTTVSLLAHYDRLRCLRKHIWLST
ncbi:hypothetical protein F4560_003430 [Saccharothrix ecbatanensis]|uniref:Transposase n=1 Tax=Saccharothrix ecbatanensis TaxID=1105145 RepID=A0A7W9HJW9_9PSEU|nr:hypothetical protein [Saccharothrix ecbatanensis]